MLHLAAALLLWQCAPAVARVGDGWGTNIHWTAENAPGEAAMLAKAFKIARMDFDWASIERTPGVYDFTAYDRLLATMEAHGVRPYWILDYGNPLYPPANSSSTPAKSCDTAACIAAYGALAAAAAAHFHGHGIIWETVNEPNGMGGDNATDLAALALAASPAFLPRGETFVGPTTAGMDWAYLERAFAAGILAAYSNVSVHPYRAGPPESVLQDWAQLAALTANYTPPGGQQPLTAIDGEWGYTSATPPCVYGNKVSQLGQAKYVARMWLCNALAGVNVSISYDWRDDGSDPANCEDNFGSVHAAPSGNASAPYAPKPAYLAALAAQSGVGEAGWLAGRMDPAPPCPLPPEDVFVLRFEGYIPPTGGAPRPAFAAWTNATQCPAQPPPSGRADCGFRGITQAACAARQCCWDGGAGGPPPGQPQCYAGGPVAPTPVSFAVAPSSGGACWRAVDVLGAPLPPVCEQGGLVTVALSDGPVYLL